MTGFEPEPVRVFRTARALKPAKAPARKAKIVTGASVVKVCEDQTLF